MNVYFALLALLADGPKSGLWLGEELAADTGGMHPLNALQVYPALARLERAGLVARPGRAGLVERSTGADGADDPQQEFRITADGRRELAGWLRAAPTPGALPGDELVLKIQLAGQVPGTDVHEVIQAHRRHLLELMQRRTRARHDSAGQNLGRALASYAELFRLDSVIRWLDTAEGLLAARPADRSASRPQADQIWASDADRERVVASLRDHFAEGRLTRAELDERLTVALSARKAGDLRRLLADLPQRPALLCCPDSPRSGAGPFPGPAPDGTSRCYGMLTPQRRPRGVSQRRSTPHRVRRCTSRRRGGPRYLRWRYWKWTRRPPSSSPPQCRRPRS